MQCSAMQCLFLTSHLSAHCAALCNMEAHLGDNALHCADLHTAHLILLHFTPLHCTAPYSSVLHSTVLLCTALHCITLLHTNMACSRLKAAAQHWKSIQAWKSWQTAQTPFAGFFLSANIFTKNAQQKRYFLFTQNFRHCEDWFHFVEILKSNSQKRGAFDKCPQNVFLCDIFFTLQKFFC